MTKLQRNRFKNISRGVGKNALGCGKRTPGGLLARKCIEEFRKPFRRWNFELLNWTPCGLKIQLQCQLCTNQISFRCKENHYECLLDAEILIFCHVNPFGSKCINFPICIFDLVVLLLWLSNCTFKQTKTFWGSSIQQNFEIINVDPF